METKEFFELQEEFFAIARKNLQPDSEEAFSDVIEEAVWQVNDWYNGESYYPKPEDILTDFFFLTHEQAHRFLPLFKEKMDGET
ncbi:MAG: hypothetical protein J6S67_12935 [Methanobrevibacter sp.]|nr:hypothetical protein [Methanobrevibacter sp.]